MSVRYFIHTKDIKEKCLKLKRTCKENNFYFLERAEFWVSLVYPSRRWDGVGALTASISKPGETGSTGITWRAWYLFNRRWHVVNWWLIENWWLTLESQCSWEVATLIFSYRSNVYKSWGTNADPAQEGACRSGKPARLTGYGRHQDRDWGDGGSWPKEQHCPKGGRPSMGSLQNPQKSS